MNGTKGLVCNEHGGVWFTDLGKSYGRSREQGSVDYALADGSKIVRWREQIPTPNGIGLSPDGRALYVAESLCGRVWACDIAEPGVLAQPEEPRLAGRVIRTLPGDRKRGV